MDPMLLTLKFHPHKKTWVAEITGRCRKFGLAREFLGMIGGKPKKKGTVEYLLDPGRLYEVCELNERRFVETVDNAITYLTRDEAIAVVRMISQRDRQAGQDVDNAIVRFNSEGGFSNN